MKRATIAASCLLAGIGLWNGTLAQQPSDPVVTTVPVEITDLSGRPVADLQSKDFVVLENSKALEIKTFAKGEDAGTYLLGYSPEPNAGSGPIDVIVHRPNLRVRLRPDPSARP